MDRRRFLKLAGGATASGALIPKKTNAFATASSNIYELHDPKMTTGTRVNPASVNKTLAMNAVHSLAMKMGKSDDLGKAWQNLLPGILKTDKVAIKVNCLKPETSPQFCTLEAIVKGLTSMFAGTFPAKNIMLFDNDLAVWVFKPDHVNNAFGKSELDKLGIWHQHDTYKGPSIKISGKSVYISTAWNQGKNHCINFLCPRPHSGQPGAGYLSGHIKNMMGAVSTQKGKYVALLGGGGFHDPKSPRAYSDMMKNPAIGGKTALYIGDYILVPKHENSVWSKFGNRIVFGTDPCAMDSYAVDLFWSLGYKGADRSPTKLVPKACAGAGAGTISYKKIATTYASIKPSRVSPKPVEVTVSARPFRHASATIRIPRGEKMQSLSIYGLNGRLVREIDLEGWKSAIMWDGRNHAGRRVSSGTYLVRLNCSKTVREARLTLVR